MKCKDTAQKNGPCPADAVAILVFGSYLNCNKPYAYAPGTDLVWRQLSLINC